jgi:hypothetical protein
MSVSGISGESLMFLRKVSAIGAATALTLAVGCSSDKATPVSPSTAAVSDSDAASDGSTLKVTAPGAVSPQNGEEVKSSAPVFTVNNAHTRFGVPAALEYRFEVYTESGQFVVNSVRVAGGDGATSWEIPRGLDQGTYKWHARAEMGSSLGPWSEFSTFKITAPPSLLPNGPYPRDPVAIVNFVGASYPEKLKARVSLQERKDNMAFLRDRIIEVALCTGQVMGRNLKRGGPEFSFDFLAWKTGGKTWGVDLASGYDATDKPLRLHWAPHAPRAFFAALPNPQPCRN